MSPAPRTVTPTVRAAVRAELLKRRSTRKAPPAVMRAGPSLRLAGCQQKLWPVWHRAAPRGPVACRFDGPGCQGASGRDCAPHGWLWEWSPTDAGAARARMGAWVRPNRDRLIGDAGRARAHLRLRMGWAGLPWPSRPHRSGRWPQLDCPGRGSGSRYRLAPERWRSGCSSRTTKAGPPRWARLVRHWIRWGFSYEAAGQAPQDDLSRARFWQDERRPARSVSECLDVLGIDPAQAGDLVRADV